MHPPNDYGIHGCQLILLSDEFYWYTSNNIFGFFSIEDDYRTSSNFHRYSNIVEIIIPSATPTIQCRDDLRIHDFDRAM